MKNIINRIMTGMVLGTIFWLLLLYTPPLIFSLLLIGIIVHIMLFEWGKFFNYQSPLFWVIAPFYPILPFILLLLLNVNPAYHELLVMLFVIVSSFDTSSFIGGTLFGRHKIAPAISPKKTWEGFLCGCASALFSMWFVMRYKAMNPDWSLVILVTLITCIFALCGDLFESWLKRRAGLKDSGSILPGHGGWLDRFDAMLFAVCFFYIFKNQLLVILTSSSQ